MLDWLSYFWYEANFCASMTALTLGFSLRTEGMRHVPRQGPALLIANHQSYFDPIVIGLAARRHLTYMARSGLFGFPVFNWFIRSLNAIPINQEGIGIEGLRLTLENLREGRAMAIFPEGERSWDGKMQPLKPGVHLLIKRAPAPLIPVGIAGVFEAWPRQRLVPIPAPLFLPAGNGTIAVSIGPPVDPRRFINLPRERVLLELADELERMRQQAERLRRKP
jgi:1-acyl-sn-glycerol-3-phosphate acyltransferase